MKITGKPQLPAAFAASFSSKTLNPSPDSDLQYHKPSTSTRRSTPRRATRNPTCLRRTEASNSGRRSRPETPLLGWKIHHRRRKNDEENDKSPSRRECRQKVQEEVVVSARKLATGLWRLQMPEMKILETTVIGIVGTFFAVLSKALGAVPRRFRVFHIEENFPHLQPYKL